MFHLVLKCSAESRWGRNAFIIYRKVRNRSRSRLEQSDSAADSTAPLSAVLPAISFPATTGCTLPVPESAVAASSRYWTARTPLAVAVAVDIALAARKRFAVAVGKIFAVGAVGKLSAATAPASAVELAAVAAAVAVQARAADFAARPD